MTLFPAGSIFADSMYNNATSQAAAAQKVGLDRNAEDQALSDRNFGYGAAGALNPFSQTALLGRNQAIEARDQMNSYAKRPGSLRSGAYGIRRGNLLFGQEGARAGLRDRYDASTLGFTRNAADIETTFNNTMDNAAVDSNARKASSDAIAADQAKSDAATAQETATQANNAAATAIANQQARFKKAGYIMGSTGTNAKGTYFYARQPNTGTLYRIYSDGSKFPL